jgi:outer membrane protein TolC
MRIPALFLIFAACATAGEVKTLTLKQALALALEQNPDVLLARLDQQKARNQILIAKDAFQPKVTGGAGLAWSNGTPTVIDGNPPSIFEVRTDMALFDRSQSYKIAQAKENLRGSGFDVTRRQEDAAYRVATLFLDAEQAAHSLDSAEQQVKNLSKVKDLVDARVADGRELPLESKRANMNMLIAKNNVEKLNVNLMYAEMSLAQVLGMGPDDRVHAAQEERTPIAVPASEDASIEEALAHSPELRRLESDVEAKTLEVKSYRAARLPKVNLVAQDNVAAHYNYSDSLYPFRRNLPELGASITVPFLVGRTAKAYAMDAEADVERIKVTMGRTRSQIASDLRRAYQEVKSADSSRELAKADLDFTRDELSVDLAQYEEGKLPLSKIEALRATENEKFLTFYVSQQTSERARLNVLRLTGTLVAALK